MAFALLPALLAAGCGGGEEAPVEPPAAAAGARTPQAGDDVHVVPAPRESPWPSNTDILPVTGPGFPDEAAARGLDYVNRSGAPEKPYILGANGAGVALLDLQGDGDLDAVFAQGLESLEAFAAGGGATLEPFHNDGTGNFERAEAPEPRAWWTGLAAGDVDNDGDADLVAAAYGDLLLFEQQADGALLPRRESGLAPEQAAIPWWATSVVFLDADLDGVLDLYVGQYLELDPEDPPRGELGSGALAIPCWWKGMEVFCGPRGMTPQPDRLLRGEGGGAFADATATWLPEHVPGFTLAAAAFDADFDGDSDLYVANDSSPNLMLVNDLAGEPGAFVDRGLTAGVAVNPDGAAEAGMGVAPGDVDRNGQLDFCVTNFSDEPTHLYLGRPVGFSNQSYRMGLANASRRLLSWSAHLVDFDGDGWQELFTANGHVFPQADAEGTGTRYAQPDTLWRLFPRDKVERVWPRRRDSILAIERGTRGTAVGDVDGDGAPDLLLAAIDGPCALGMNRLDPAANRLVVRCVGAPDQPGPSGRRSPRDAQGAKLILVPRLPEGMPPESEFALLREVRTGVGYQSASSPEVHFGLGGLAEYTQLSVLWPSGRTTELGPGKAGRRLVVEETKGIVAEEEL